MTPEKLRAYGNRFEDSLVKLGRRESTAPETFSKMSAILDDYVEASSTADTPGGYVRAIEILRRVCYPDYGLAGIHCDVFAFPAHQERYRTYATSIGLFLLAAVKLASPEVQTGARMLDRFLNRSGWLPSDVIE